MNKTINLFIDMDGTIAKFYHKKNYLELMYEKDYFRTLPTYAIAKQINEFVKQASCVQVYILSACVESEYCEQEKVEWLIEHMPNISPEHFIFTKVGENKVAKARECVADFGNNINILLDDYTYNLEQWEMSLGLCMGVKFLNGINDTTKSWHGRKVKTFKQLERLLQQCAMYGYD
jgi:5'(3')-deoxyribonucleotidase